MEDVIFCKSDLLYFYGSILYWETSNFLVSEGGLILMFICVSEIKSIKERYKSRREKLAALKQKVRSSMEQQFDDIFKEVSNLLPKSAQLLWACHSSRNKKRQY